MALAPVRVVLAVAGAFEDVWTRWAVRKDRRPGFHLSDSEALWLASWAELGLIEAGEDAPAEVVALVNAVHRTLIDRHAGGWIPDWAREDVL